MDISSVTPQRLRIASGSSATRKLSGFDGGISPVKTFLGKCLPPRPLREQRPRTQAATRQGVLCCVALFVVADVCVSRASQRSTFCFFSTPGTAK